MKATQRTLTITTTIGLLFLILNSPKSKALEFNTSIGAKQGVEREVNLALEERIEYPSGIFHYHGYKFSIVEYEDQFYRQHLQGYHLYQNDREDELLYVGGGYELQSGINLSAYAGLGMSKRKVIDGRYEYHPTTGNPILKKESIQETNEAKQQIGLRLGYEFGDRDINPYFEYNKTKYEDANSIYGFVFGASFMFY